MENLLKMDDLGGFTPTFGNTHVYSHEYLRPPKVQWISYDADWCLFSHVYFQGNHHDTPVFGPVFPTQHAMNGISEDVLLFSVVSDRWFVQFLFRFPSFPGNKSHERFHEFQAKNEVQG